MKKLLSRKFLMALASAVVIICNDAFDLNIDKDTVLTFAGIVATWIAVEGATDVARKPKVSDVEQAYHSE